MLTLPWFAIRGGHDNDDTHRDPPMRQLEVYLAMWSSNLYDRSHGTNWSLTDLVITRPLLVRLLPILLHGEIKDNDKNHMEHELHFPGTSSNDTPILTFQRVQMKTCRFFSHSDVTMSNHDNDVCTDEDKACFLSALARLRFTVVDVHYCPEILSGWLSIAEIDRWEVPTLKISQEEPLSELEYKRLGAIIRRSVHTTNFCLELPFVDVPQEFNDSLANSVHIKGLGLMSTAQGISNYQSNLIVGEDGNGGVERLLRNPLNQLRALTLSRTHLEDHHLAVLAQLLPISKVVHINFGHNHIQLRGLLEFARHIPKMNSLQVLFLGGNPWQEAPLEDIEKCSAALLHGLIQNTSIELLDVAESLPKSRRLMGYYFALNSGGRKLLQSSPHPLSQEKEQPIVPDGLWPRILARAAKITVRYDVLAYHNQNDIVYYFLQNCPKICDYAGRGNR